MDSTSIFQSIASAIFQTSLVEWLIFITAIFYVILATIENSWCWFFGILSSALSIYLCFTGKLFLESGLNIFYVLIGAYGWYQWKFGSQSRAELSITSYSLKKNLILFFIGVIIWMPFGFIAHRYSTQVLPYLDAFITAFSIVATWMTAKKIIENWLYWIVIDSLAIVLYATRGFYLIALLYIIYTLLAAGGYFSWRKKITL